MVSAYFYLLLFNALLQISASTSVCHDKVHNRFVSGSLKDDLPIRIENLVADAYDVDMKPACARGAPNVVLPGYILLSKGEAHVSEEYDFENNTMVKLTAISEGGTKYCVDGKSVQWFLPDYYCYLNLCDYIGMDMCGVLEKRGVHTIKELVEKIDFNPKLKLPDPPCFLGLLCITDFMGGNYLVEFNLEYKNKTVLRWKVPNDKKYLQLVGDDEDDDDD